MVPVDFDWEMGGISSPLNTEAEAICIPRIGQTFRTGEPVLTDKLIVLFQPAARHVKGHASGSRATRPSAKRIRGIYGELQPQTEYQSKKTANALPDTRTSADFAYAKTWATNVMNTQPVLGAQVQLEASAPSTRTSSSDGTTDVGGERSISDTALPTLAFRRMEREVHKLITTTDENFRKVFEMLEQQNAYLLHNASGAFRYSPSGVFSTNAISTIHESHRTSSSVQQSVAIPGMAPDVSISSASTRNAVTSVLCPSGIRRTIVFEDIEITFDTSVVPNPPAISFADDIPKLVREWYSSTILVIVGHGIPIRHWDKVYTKKAKVKKGAWASFRSTWNNWGFIVAEFESYPSEAQFWNNYQDENGQRLCYQHILAKLKEARKTNRANIFAADAAAARKVFGNDLQIPQVYLDTGMSENAFCYKKSGKWRTYTTDEKIAECWNGLLDENEELRDGRTGSS